MADVLKLSQSVTFTEEDINRTQRFLDETVSHSPISHEKGKATLPGNTINYELATNANLCSLILKSGNPFSLKVGDTTAPSITNVRLFSYDASATSIFVSNSDTDPVVIEYVTAKF